MKKLLIGFGVTFLVIVFILFLVIVIAMAVWNNLNAKEQAVKGGQSGYSAALEVCTQKIKGVWELSSQYLDHESGTFRAVAEARSGFLAAKETFDMLRGDPNSTQFDMTRAAAFAQQMFRNLQNAGLSVNVQLEKYPDLRGAETTQNAMRALEEGVNEIKTALDDWIFAIKDYNTYRGSAFPSFISGVFGFSKFPSEIEYFRGSVERLDIDSLNPRKK
jgi:hypothetical protein